MPTRVGRARLAYDLWRQYGTGPMTYRLAHAALRRVGLLERRFPARGWDAAPLAAWCPGEIPTEPAAYRQYRQQAAGAFFFAPGQLPEIPAEWTAAAVGRAAEIRSGQLRYFSATTADVGFPFDWFRNPFTGEATDARRHWCRRNDFELGQGDIKVIWEPSRFSWAYDLVRAYQATGDNEHAETFWQLFESWRRDNPPNMGPNWQCGQECALRMMAMCFAVYAFWGARATTDERVAALSQTVAVHAHRIEGNIRFARVQQGNHAVSEAAALYTAGALFREFAAADRWRRHARVVLEEEARRFNFEDGSYVQHSMNYHRLMLHGYLWTLRLAELADERVSQTLRQKLQRAVSFVYQLQDEHGGRVPNYGPNDGALALPINSCSYLDYRPIVGAMCWMLQGHRVYEAGPWDEDRIWLFGAAADDAPPRPPRRLSSAFPDGGYYTLRGRDTWGMVRCHTYRSHPHQADMLHLDVWWKGLNVLRDSGTYSYNAAEPWRNHFVSTASHNTVVLGGEDQMIKVRRFSWAYPVRSRTQFFTPNSETDVDYFQGEHYGYRRLPTHAVHRRAVLRAGHDLWIVVDDVLGRGEEQIEVFWHLLDAPFEVHDRDVYLQTEAGPVQLWVTSGADDARLYVARGERGDSPLGWQSLYYGVKEPAPTARLRFRAALPQRIVTCLSLGRPLEVAHDARSGAFRWEQSQSGQSGQLQLAQLASDAGPIVAQVRMNEAQWTMCPGSQPSAT